MESELTILSLIVCGFILYAIICIVAVLLLYLLLRKRSEPRAHAPNAYTNGLRFKNLVIYSGYNTVYTEIDEVIVSQFGIFCIEYKAHQGFIFGSKDRKIWTQCKYDGNHPVHNPIHQNYKHVKALDRVFKDQPHAPIHSYVVYTNAKKVTVDSRNVLLGEEELMEKLKNHTVAVYDLGQVEEICKILAYVSERSAERLPAHVNELKGYFSSINGTIQLK